MTFNFLYGKVCLYVFLCVCGEGVGVASLVTQLAKNQPAMQETLVHFLGHEDLWRRDRLPTPVFLGFPGGSDGKESTCNAEDLGSIPWLGRSLGGGNGNPFQYFYWKNPMDR